MSIFAATSAFAQKSGDEGAIVGGSSVNISSYPYQVSIQTTSGYHFCGGTIIDDEWILTAAHCIDGTSASSIRVMAGASRISQSSSGQIRTVTAIYAYPGYSTPSAGKDAALLKLSSPLSFNSSVQAIPYATSADAAAGLTNPGVMSTISGWGTLSSGGSSPDQLQAAQVPIVSNSYANGQYPETITADQLAAGYTSGGVDACQGDSGGPLVVSDGAGGQIVAGIVSWGYGCADARYPGMYGRVSSFATWIDGYVGGTTGGGGGGSTSYCASKGNNSSYEWIQQVDFANLWYANSGDNGGYVSYDASAWSVYQGNSYPISIDVAFSGSSYREYYRVWIDFNGDGDFNDSGEQVLSKNSTSTSGVSGTFTVPSGAKSGNTRMRVSMKYNAYATPCETFSYGEVEDYTINIGGVRGGMASEGITARNAGSDAVSFMTFPNPAQTSTTLKMDIGMDAKNVNVSLIDVTGAVITTVDYPQFKGMLEHKFDVSALDQGMYLISVDVDGEKTVERIAVTR